MRIHTYITFFKNMILHLLMKVLALLVYGIHLHILGTMANGKAEYTSAVAACIRASHLKEC